MQGLLRSRGFLLGVILEDLQALEQIHRLGKLIIVLAGKLEGRLGLLGFVLRLVFFLALRCAVFPGRHRRRLGPRFRFVLHAGDLMTLSLERARSRRPVTWLTLIGVVLLAVMLLMQTREKKSAASTG